MTIVKDTHGSKSVIKKGSTLCPLFIQAYGLNDVLEQPVLLLAILHLKYAQIVPEPS